MRLPNKSDSQAGTIGWCLLGASVLAWDLLASETLTHSFQRGYEHPIGKFLLIGAIGATTLHLTGLVPPEHDIYYGFGKLEPYEN